jgi:hypothetical protein
MLIFLAVGFFSRENVDRIATTQLFLIRHHHLYGLAKVPARAVV